MTRPSPDFGSLIDPRTTGHERNLIRRAHEALVVAGPLPELPLSLLKAPAVRSRSTSHWTRPSRALLAACAAALALATATLAYLGTSQSTEPARAVIAMHATAAAPAAHATLRVGARDRAGNTHIRLRVRGLPVLPSGSYYEMFLTDKNRVVGACGTFKTDGGDTIVDLNVPYRLGEYSGWLIRSEHLGTQSSPPLLSSQT
jgi:Anti-sigma-K factor rskA